MSKSIVRLSLIMAVFFFISGSVQEVPAWGSLGPGINGYPTFKAHARVAWEVVNQPDVAAWLALKGLDPKQVALAATREPPGWDHWGYDEIASGAFLSEMEPTVVMIGKLLHCTGDNGVAVNHSPANRWYTDSDLVEVNYEGAGEIVVMKYTWTPAQNTFSDEATLFLNAMELTTNAFKNLPFWKKFAWDNSVKKMAGQSLSDCTRWSHAAMRYYIDNAP